MENMFDMYKEYMSKLFWIPKFFSALIQYNLLYILW